MTPPKNRPTEHNTRPKEAKNRTIAVIAAWACIGVAVVAAALSFLF